MKRILRYGVLGLLAVAVVMEAAGQGTTKPRKAPPVPVWQSIADEPTLAQAVAPVLGAASAQEWMMQVPVKKGPGMVFTAVQDGNLGQPAFFTEGRSQILRREWTGDDFNLEFAVKLVSTRSVFNLLFYPQEGTSAPPAALDLAFRSSKTGFTVSVGKSRTSFKARAYDTILPMWPDFVRIPLEMDMATLPDVDQRWFRVRVVGQQGRMEVWVEDRFIARSEGMPPVCRLEMKITEAMGLAGWTLEKATATTGLYDPISLDGYVRDRALRPKGVGVADGALPFGGRLEVQGVPFQLVRRLTPAAPDHIDVGRSLVRQGTMEGYIPTTGPRLGDAFTPDPARIQLRLPQDQYDRLYVLAAFDGEPNSIPLFSAAFYRPKAGFHEIFEGTVPGLTDSAAAGEGPVAVPITLSDGLKAHLWRIEIPLDPARLAGFADLNAVELELTKKMQIYRSYPDPISYGWHGAGLPSGVRIFGLTLRRAPAAMSLEPEVFGHVWTDPAVPAYRVEVTNRTAAALKVQLTAETESYDGREKSRQSQSLTLKPGAAARVPWSFKVKRNGLHTLTLTMEADGTTRRDVRYFARLPKDTRAPFWKEGEGPLFGYWSYHGGHDTPPAADIMRVMQAAGARAIAHKAKPGSEARQLFDDWKWRDAGYPRAVNLHRAWSDPAKIEAYSNATLKALREHYDEKTDFISFYAEPALSRNLTAGHPPDYWGDPPYVMDAAESNALVNFMRTSQYVAEMVRANWPKAKVLIPWGDPLFVVPLLRAGFPRSLIDGSGLDMIGFERLPEQQLHQMSTHRLYILREEYRKAGNEKPFLPYVEGIFSPTEPGALTWEEQADRYHRWSLLSLAYGIEQFYSGWFAYDCASYYGAEHYGGCGIQRRIPYCDPKPGYVHFATMTRQLDRARFAGWLPTGSHTVFALKFERPGGPVHVFWTVRGRRSVELEAAGASELRVTDAMDNAEPVPVSGGRVSIGIGSSPVYVSGAAELRVAALGEPDHSDSVVESRTRDGRSWQNGLPPPANPIAFEKILASLGDGRWAVDAAARDEIYEKNNFDTKRFHGRMTASVTNDPGRPGSALAIRLEAQDQERKLMPWYSIVKPAKPLAIPGKAAALGLWVKAASDWGRVVYALRDARGERWISIGTPDQWNCNDPHGWSMFNFDGWRYLRFELPGSAPYDRFRESGTVWWGSYGGDGIVDQPLTLESMIVERRTHVMYVNDIQPANPADVLLGDLVAEYVAEADATPAAVALDRVRIPLPRQPAKMANPIADLAARNALAPVTIEKVTMPDWGYDGTRCHVHFNEIDGATEYQVWVGAYPDGRGAVKIGSMKKSGGLVNNLRPAMKLYLWVTYVTTAADKKTGQTPPESSGRPSNAFEIELVDAFSQK